MNYSSFKCVVLAAGLCFAAAGPARSEPLPPPPSATQIIERVLRQAQDSGAGVPVYHYSRLTVTEELDNHGKIKERKEKLYEVSSQGDLPTLKSVRVNGRTLSDGKLQEEQARESRIRQQLMARKGTKRDMTEIVLTPDLVAKYRF